MDELVEKRRALFDRYYSLTQEQEQKILNRDLPGLESLLVIKNTLISDIDDLNRKLGNREDSAVGEIIRKITSLERSNIQKAEEQLGRIKQDIAEIKRRKKYINTYLK